MGCRAPLVPNTWPRYVTSVTRRNSSGMISVNGARIPAKALSTQTSMRPKASVTTKALPRFGRAFSHGMRTGVTPGVRLPGVDVVGVRLARAGHVRCPRAGHCGPGRDGRHGRVRPAEPARRADRRCAAGGVAVSCRQFRLVRRRPGRGRTCRATQRIRRRAENHRGDQCGGPVRQPGGEAQSQCEREGRARVQGDGAGRGVQRGPAALPARLLAQFVADGLTRHLCQLVDQLLVQVLKVIQAVHGRRVPVQAYA